MSRRATAALAAAAACGSAGTASAHAGAAQDPWSWSLDPWVVTPLLLAALGYLVALRRLRRRAGGARAVGLPQEAAFAAGVLVLFLALASPLDRLGAQLFSAHMVQHLLLMLVAAPLWAFGRAGLLLFWALPRRPRRGLARLAGRAVAARLLGWLAHPLSVWVLFCGAFVFWHLPGPYEAALRSDLVHAVEHASFFLTAYAFWSVVIEPSGRRRLDYGSTLLFVVAAAILGGLPGALLIFAPLPLYELHAEGAALWGLGQLEDQQLAGVIMWVPGGLAYLAAASALFLLWLREAERRMARRARRAAPVACLLLAVALLLPGCRDEGEGAALAAVGGDPEAGERWIEAYGCGSCHDIPGIERADGLVGPPLDRMGRRIYIAGLLRNTPDNMVTWLLDPQAIVPGNAMPDLGMTEAQARDITAYLYTLR